MQQASRLKRKKKGIGLHSGRDSVLTSPQRKSYVQAQVLLGRGARGVRGDKRLSGGPLTPALPREMSEEAAGCQTSRCTLKKPWRLAGAYPNLCRRQISPGSPGRLEHSLFWHQINQMQNGRQLGLLWIQRPPEKASGHHHTHQGPKESEHLERCQGKGKEGERKSQKAGARTDEALFMCVCILVSGVIVCCPNQTKCSVGKNMASTGSATCSPERVKLSTQKMRTPLCGKGRGC